MCYVLVSATGKARRVVVDISDLHSDRSHSGESGSPGVRCHDHQLQHGPPRVVVVRRVAEDHAAHRVDEEPEFGARC